MFRRLGLSVAPRFRWECLTSRTVNWFPAPATSNVAGGFPALLSPARFKSRFICLLGACRTEVRCEVQGIGLSAIMVRLLGNGLAARVNDFETGAHEI